MKDLKMLRESICEVLSRDRRNFVAFSIPVNSWQVFDAHFVKGDLVSWCANPQMYMLVWNLVGREGDAVVTDLIAQGVLKREMSSQEYYIQEILGLDPIVKFVPNE